MAKTEKGKKRNKKKDAAEVSDVPKQPGMFASMKPETVRGIGGVLLFVLGVLLVLAGIPDMAGPLGNVSYQGLFMVFGVGYWLLPIMVAAWALALFKRDYAENKLRPIRTTGALLGFVSLLAILSVVGNERIGGLLGSYTARPLLASLETVATLVILAGLIVVSLLLLFDSELWAKIFQKLFGIFKRKSEEPVAAPEIEDAEVGDEEEPEAEEDDSYLTPPQPAADAPNEMQPRRGEPVRESPQKMPPLETIDEPGSVPALTTYQPPSEYKAPPLSYLEQDSGKPNAGNTKQRSNLIQQTLRHFKIPVEMDEIVVGPAVTRFALKPAEGVKLQRITNLKQNLEMALEAHPIRIEAPIPGRSLVGIEVPNTGRSLVGLAGLLASPKFAESNKHLLFALGKDITGGMHFADIADLPHLLIAGATKSGKSVMVHTLINSLLYRNGPTQLRLILVDPKQVELTLYENLPHLLTPVITDAKKAIRALMWAGKEMENRYEQLRTHKVRDIGEYLSTVYHPALEALPQESGDTGGGEDDDGAPQTSQAELPLAMPHIVVIIDELADIMQLYPRELEGAIVKLAQKSRAVGIHLVLSTQSPRADVVTGIIKANMPARMALKVTSGTESRIILDDMGAEQLLGNGDMLWKAPDMSKPRRIQSPFVSGAEVKKIVAYIVNNNIGDLTNILPNVSEGEGDNSAGGFGSEEGVDDLYEQVREYVIQERRASTSLIQRRFKVGYGRAARIMDQLEERGIIEKSDGTNRPRMLRPEYGGGAMGDGVEGE